MSKKPRNKKYHPRPVPRSSINPQRRDDTMTQDRRKDGKLPEGPLVFTDRNLTAAGLAHLEAERAAACLVHAGDDVWVGVGTKDALRGLLSEDTASQSQAVPSELASLQAVAVMVPNGRYHTYPAMTSEGSVRCKVSDQLVKLSDVQSLLSHSAATGKAEAVAAMTRAKALKVWDDIPHVLHVELDTIFKYLSAPLAAAMPAEEARDEYSVIVQLPDIHTKLIEAYTAGAMRSGGDGIDAGAYKCAEKIMRAWDLPDAPAEPAPIQASAERIEQLESVVRCSVDDLERIHLALGLPADDPIDAKVMVEHIARHIAAQAPAGRDAQQWISVDERLPEDNQTVAILYWPYNNHENSQVAGAAEYVDGTFYTHEGDDHHPPSHWAPIPAVSAAHHAAEQTSGGEHADPAR